MNAGRTYDPRCGRRLGVWQQVLLGAAVICVVVTWRPLVARAGGGALFGEASRTASLADAVTARPGELSAIFYNPGALADLQRGMATLTAHVGRMNLSFARHDEPAVQFDRTIAGFGVAIGTRLPGPDWLRAFRIGAAAHLPAQHALRLIAPSRPDEPSFPLYGDRAERISVTASLAAKLFDRIGIGVGVTLAPTLYSPTKATYVAGRGTETENVVLDIERELKIGAALVAGVRAQLIDQLALGLAYRQQIDTRAYGPNDVQAGQLVVEDEVDFYDLLAPEEIAAGVGIFPIEALSLSVDLVLARWARYRTIHNVQPPQPFSDVYNLRLGIEWLTPFEGLAARVGYAFEPSPISEQTGETNLLGGDAHVLAVGAGFDFDRRGWAPLRVDTHFRTHLLQSQQVDKNSAELADTQPDVFGQQINNLGYPGFTAEGHFWQFGLTINYFFGERER